MSQFSHDDDTLINFLKQYRPPVPQNPPDLEEKIMATLEAEDRMDHSPRLNSSQTTIRALSCVSSLIAASLTLLWIGDQIFSSASLTPKEQSQLEGFIESNWNGAMEENQETSWLTMLEKSQD